MSEEPARRQLLCQAGNKTFMLTVPSDAHVTFGPWSPPVDKEARYDAEGKRGTLRVYAHDKKLILGVFSGVTSFRDLSLISYAEQVEKVEASTIWRDDAKGYFRQTTGTREREWVDRNPELPNPGF